MEFAGTQTEAETFQGKTVFSAEGEKVGDVDKVLYDKATGKPEWLAIQTGLVGRKSRLTPFAGAERRADGVSVPYSASPSPRATRSRRSSSGALLHTTGCITQRAGRRQVWLKTERANRKRGGAAAAGGRRNELHASASQRAAH